MTREENSFALLGGEEVDDLSTFLERVSAKVDAFSPPAAPKRRNNQKSRCTPSTPNFPSRTLPAAEYVSSERGRGRGRGRGSPGRGSGSSGGNDVVKFEYGRPNGCQRNGGVDGYRSHRDNGFHQKIQNYGTANGYSAENTFDGNKQEQGYCHGRGQQRGSDEEHGFGNQIQVVMGNEQPEYQDPKGGFGGRGGSDKLTNGHNYRQNRQLRDGNRNNGGGGPGHRAEEGSKVGGREGRNNRRGEIMSKSGTKEAPGVDGAHAVSGDGNTGGDNKNVSATIKISKDAESEQEKLDRLARQEYLERKAREEEEEKKKMTLEQYEMLLMEKRKALETIYTTERKVTVDKDFKLMHLVEKKKDDSLFIKPKPEKDELKRKDTTDKTEKVLKAKTRQLSLDEVFHIKSSGQVRGRGQRVNREERDIVRAGAERELINRKNEAETGRKRVEPAGIRHAEQGGYRSGYSKFRVAVPAIGDSLQFPVLGKSGIWKWLVLRGRNESLIRSTIRLKLESSVETGLNRST